jgi:hypothetical protein
VIETVGQVSAILLAVLVLTLMGTYAALRYLIPYGFHLWIDVWSTIVGRSDPEQVARAHAGALARYNRGWRPLLAMWSKVSACKPENTWTDDGEKLIWLDYRCCDDGHGHMVNCGDLFAKRHE